MKELWWIDTGFACGGIILQNDLVVETAPIFRKWFLGKSRIESTKILKNKRWRWLNISFMPDLSLFYEKVFE